MAKRKNIAQLMSELEIWERRMVYAMNKWMWYRDRVAKLGRRLDKEPDMGVVYDDPIPPLGG